MKKITKIEQRKRIEEALSNHDGRDVKLTSKCFFALVLENMLEHAYRWANYYMKSSLPEDFAEINRACESAVAAQEGKHKWLSSY